MLGVIRITARRDFKPAPRGTAYACQTNCPSIGTVMS